MTSNSTRSASRTSNTNNRYLNCSLINLKGTITRNIRLNKMMVKIINNNMVNNNNSIKQNNSKPVINNNNHIRKNTIRTEICISGTSPRNFINILPWTLFIATKLPKIINTVQCQGPIIPKGWRRSRSLKPTKISKTISETNTPASSPDRQIHKSSLSQEKGPTSNTTGP